MLVEKKVLQNLLQELGEEAVSTLITLFCSDTENTINKLQLILENNDAAALALEVHTLKSVAATYGAFEVLELAKSLDSACKAQQRTIDLAPKVELLIQKLKDTSEEIKRLDLATIV